MSISNLNDYFDLSIPFHSVIILRVERERQSFNFLVIKRLCEHKVIKPKKRHKDKRPHVTTKKRQTTKHKKKDPKSSPKTLLSLQNIPPYSEVTGTCRRLRLAGVPICNRTAANHSGWWQNWCRRDGNGDETRKDRKQSGAHRCHPVRLRKNRFTSPGSRGGRTNLNFNRWVNRSSGS
jgi:hypothetical protein